MAPNDRPVDSEQQSVASMSGYKIPDPEEKVEVESGVLESDIEKQAKNATPTASPVDCEETKDPNLVEFDGPDDKDNPRNWTKKRRWIITAAMGMMTFVVTFSSSIFATAIRPVSAEFDIDQVTAALGVAMVRHSAITGIDQG